jgi:hypothetical protein
MVAAESELPAVSVAPSADAIPLKLRRRGGSPCQVLALTLVGSLVLAVFASRDLSSWLDRMGHSPLLAPLQHAAATWDDTMATLGLTRPHELLRETIRRLLDWEWRAPP